MAKKEKVEKPQAAAAPKKDCLTFKNYHARVLTTILMGRRNLPVFMHGPVARSRVRFMKLVGPRADENEKFRIELCEKYSEKGKDGKAKLIKDDQGFDRYDIKDQEALDKEYQEYLDEPFIIDILPSNKEDIRLIKQHILNSELDLDFAESVAYTEICDALE